MIHVGDELAHFLADALESPTGLAARMSANTPEGRSSSSYSQPVRVLREQIPVALLEKHTTCKFPICLVYCRKFVNSLKDKFAGVSGTAEIVAEGTVSGESLEDIAGLSSALVLSISQVLAGIRGEWGVGGYFGGGWEVQVDAIRSGGLQYIQTSKVVMVVDIKRN